MNTHNLVDWNMEIVVELYVILVPNFPSGSRIDDFPVELLCVNLKFKVARQEPAFTLAQVDTLMNESTIKIAAGTIVQIISNVVLP